MSKQITVKALRDELALEGARSRLQRIESELGAIYREFPALFPHGAPVILQRVTEAKGNGLLRSRKALDLINGAEKIRKARGKKARRYRHETADVPIPTSSDPTGETVSISEAAKLLGLTDSGVRQRIVKGKLNVFDKNGAGGTLRLRRAEVAGVQREHTDGTV